MQYSFVGGSNPVRSTNADDARMINFYAEPLVHSKGRTLLAAYGTPGLRLFATLSGPGGIRCLYRTGDNRLFAACGNGLFAVYADGTFDRLGSMNTASGPVVMADNPLSSGIVVVDGSWCYRIDMTALTTAVATGVSFPFGERVDFLDGYFLVNRPASKIFQFSGLNSNIFNALDIASKEGGSDLLVTILVHHRQLILFGQRTSEIWYNSGDALTPFQPIYGSFLEVGALSPYAVCSFAEQAWWLGGNEDGGETLYRLNGYVPQRVSGPAQEYAWAQYPKGSNAINQLHDAILYGMTREGHDYLVLHFPRGDHTWVLDLTTQLWHEWLSLGQPTESEPGSGVAGASATVGDSLLHRHRGQTHTYIFNKHLVGDYLTGAIYELRNDVYLDGTREIRRELSFPPLLQELKDLYHVKLQVDMAPGVGTVAPGQGQDPQMAVQWSDDGGHTWKTERWRHVGKAGATRFRALWHQLGRARDRRYKIIFTDPVEATILNAYVDILPGAA